MFPRKIKQNRRLDITSSISSKNFKKYPSREMSMGSVLLDQMSLAEKIAEFLSAKYPKIQLIAVYGSVGLGNAQPKSDLDMFAVIGDGPSVALNFIYNGYAVDLWPMTWDELGSTVAGESWGKIWCVYASTLLENKILFSRSEEITKKYHRMTEKLKDNTKTVNIGEIYTLYDDCLAAQQHMTRHPGTTEIANVSRRWQGWRFLNSVCCILAFLNKKYYTKNWGANIAQAKQFQLLPAEFSQLTDTIACAENPQEVLDATGTLMEGVRTLITNHQAQRQLPIIPDVNHNKSDIVGYKEYFNKVYKGCHVQDLLQVSYAYSELQVCIPGVLSELGNTEYNYYYNTYDEFGRLPGIIKIPDITRELAKADFEGILAKTNQFEKNLATFWEKQFGALPTMPETSENLRFDAFITEKK